MSSFEVGNLYFSNLNSTGQVSMWMGMLISWLVLVGLHRRHGSKASRIGQRITDHLESKPAERFPYIDTTRGLAISFVVFFHYMWNLRHNNILPPAPHEKWLYSEKMFQIGEFWIFFLVSFIILSEVFNASVFLGYAGFVYVTGVCINWHYWASQTSGVGMIMYCIGLSSYIQNRNGMRWQKIWSRIRQLVLVAACISAVTYALFGDTFVYFGAIHCIALVSILHIPFVMYPKFAILGVMCIFSHAAILGEFFLEVPLRPTVDYMPWFENMGYLLIGITSGHFGIYKATHYIRCMWGKGQPGIRLQDTVFPFLGRHSLMIFIAHQLVLYPVVKLVGYLI
jgi:uncharacterized membrane protein